MSQIKTKFIEDNAVNGQKMRLRNAEAIRARNAAGTSDVDLLRLSASDEREIPGHLSLTNNRLKLVGDAVADTDAPNFGQVKNLINGLSPKERVNAATTGALPACVYANGSSGVGATLTGSANGALPAQDGVTLVSGDRLLVKDQASGLQNGIYTVTQIGDASNPFILTRAADADSEGDVSSAFTKVMKGTAFADHEFLLTTDEPITIGTTSLTFADYGETAFAAGNGISKSGIVISTSNGAGIGYDGDGKNEVKVHSTAVSGTVKVNGSNQVESLKAKIEAFPIDASIVSNGYVDLAQVAHTDSVRVRPIGGLYGKSGSDFTLSYQGGSGSKTRVTFAGTLASLIEAGDEVIVEYQYL